MAAHADAKYGESLKTAISEVLKEMGLDTVVKRLDDVEKEVTSLKQQVYELNVMCVRLANERRGRGRTVPYLEMPTPEGKVPSDLHLPKVTCDLDIAALTEAEAKMLLSAWGVVVQDPKPHQSRLTGLQGQVKVHTITSVQSYQ